MAKLRLATNGRQKNPDGSWEKTTEWHNVVAFGKTAEMLDQYAPKGKELVIEGRLQTRSYEDRDGNKRYSTEVIVENVELVGPRVEKPSQPAFNGEGDEIDLPF